jgi:hypothetical protein
MNLSLSNGTSVDMDIGADGSGTAVFVLGVRKSGSSVMNSICAALSAANGYRFVDVGGTFFAKNVRSEVWRRDPAVLKIVRPGHAYGGFREMPFVFETSEAFKNAPKILLVRDPRDAVVSEYFSNAYSHSMPQKGAGTEVSALMESLRERSLTHDIDEVVIDRAGPMRDTMMEFQNLVGDRDTRVFKYEDVILVKRRWIGDILSYLGWSCEGGLLNQILGWADVMPAKEDPRAFVRKVVPGDYRDKLKPATILEIERILAPALRLFEYDNQ